MKRIKDEERGDRYDKRDRLWKERQIIKRESDYEKRGRLRKEDRLGKERHMR